jgi:hypothetical protein
MAGLIYNELEEDFETSGHDPTEALALRDWENQEKYVQKAGVMVKIQTKHLLSTSTETYRYGNLLNYSVITQIITVWILSAV